MKEDEEKWMWQDSNPGPSDGQAGAPTAVPQPLPSLNIIMTI